MGIVNLNWSADGSPESYSIYRSETPMNANSMPLPLATGISLKSYSDNSIINNTKYYYRVGSIKGGVEKISDEIEVFAGLQNLYQYLRIYISANNGDADLTGIQEIELASTAGGADVTVPAMSTAHSSAYGGYESPKLIDNDFTNISSGCWMTGLGVPFPHWVSVNLGSQQNMAEIRMWGQAATGGLPRSPKDFKIQGSNDGTTWVDIKTFTNVTGWAVGVPKTFNLIDGTYS